MKDLVDQITQSRPTTLAKRKPEKRKEMTLGHMTIGPRLVIPPGAKLISVKGTKPKCQTQSGQQRNESETGKESKSTSETKEPEKESEPVGELGMQQIRRESLQKSESDERNNSGRIQMDIEQKEQLKSEGRMQDTTPSTELREQEGRTSVIRREVSLQKYVSSKEVVLEVVNSIDASERRLVECIDSQVRDQPERTIKLMDPHRAHTVIEATKGILVGMKLKLDAAKILREMEGKDETVI